MFVGRVDAETPKVVEIETMEPLRVGGGGSASRKPGPLVAQAREVLPNGGSSGGVEGHLGEVETAFISAEDRQ